MSPEHMLMIEDVMHENYEIVIKIEDTTDQQNPGDGRQKKACYVRKYTANGSLPLHESVVFTDSGQSAFVYLDGDGKLRIVSHLERPDKILYPADNIDSQNPRPFIFASPEELQMYIELAKCETFDSQYQQVKLELQKYVNIDEHYLVVIAADIIFSYFQDKFSTVHYDVFVGDNGSGKNSALLAIRRLGYRVFYILSASAANYFTFYADIEECQGTIAEDEVGDLDRDVQKQKILKSGYTSGGTVPKIDFVNGKRSQVPYHVYGMKWIVMEELPDSRKTRGIFDRSFIFKFIVGHVDHNIKDIIRYAGEPRFKPLNDTLIHTHKLLFAFRLIYHSDVVPDIEINLENRNAELTKPLLRLFLSRNDAPIAVDEIRLALSKFIAEKNELKSNSIESKMYQAIINLIKEDPISKIEYEFTNEQIWEEFKHVLNGIDIYKESVYSTDLGKVTHKQITGLYKSKFKAEPYQTSGNDSRRGLRFRKEVLERIGMQYTSEDEIKILNEDEKSAVDKSASDASDASLFKSVNPVSALEQVSEKPVYNSADPNSWSCESDYLTEVTDSITNDKSCGTAIDAATNNSNNNYNNSNNNNNNKQITNLSSDVIPANTASSGQIELYSNNTYTPLKSDASDASDASSILHNDLSRAKTKAEQVGKPELLCIYCDFKDPIEFDLSLHYIEKHRQQLITLPIGKSSMDYRADYAVEISKKKFFESFYEDEDNDDDIDEHEDDEE